MKFLANENFPLFSVRLMRDTGHIVFSVSEDMAGVKDNFVLSRATNEKMIILTFDRDYGDLIYKLRLPIPLGVVFTFDLTLFLQVSRVNVFWNCFRSKVYLWRGSLLSWIGSESVSVRCRSILFYHDTIFVSKK